MRPARPALGVGDAVGELAGRHGLDSVARAGLVELVELLAGDPLAPTGIRDRARIVKDHVADSLVAVELAAVRRAATIADLGSGAGIPGLVLALALPDARLWLVESSARKCAFLLRAIAACGAANAEVVNLRAEEWREGIGRCDVVTARALAPLAIVVEYAAPLLRADGRLVAWRGRRDPAAEHDARAAGSIVGLEPENVIAVRPYPGAAHRHLHVMRKVAETPARFPRRPGAARKRPLAGGASDRARR